MAYWKLGQTSTPNCIRPKFDPGQLNFCMEFGSLKSHNLAPSVIADVIYKLWLDELKTLPHPLDLPYLKIYIVKLVIKFTQLFNLPKPIWLRVLYDNEGLYEEFFESSCPKFLDFCLSKQWIPNANKTEKNDIKLNSEHAR